MRLSKDGARSFWSIVVIASALVRIRGCDSTIPSSNADATDETVRLSRIGAQM